MYWNKKTYSQTHRVRLDERSAFLFVVRLDERQGNRNTSVRLNERANTLNYGILPKKQVIFANFGCKKFCEKIFTIFYIFARLVLSSRAYNLLVKQIVRRGAYVQNSGH